MMTVQTRVAVTAGLQAERDWMFPCEALSLKLAQEGGLVHNHSLREASVLFRKHESLSWLVFQPPSLMLTEACDACQALSVSNRVCSYRLLGGFPLSSRKNGHPPRQGAKRSLGLDFCLVGCQRASSARLGQSMECTDLRDREDRASSASVSLSGESCGDKRASDLSGLRPRRVLSCSHHLFVMLHQGAHTGTQILTTAIISDVLVAMPMGKETVGR